MKKGCSALKPFSMMAVVFAVMWLLPGCAATEAPRTGAIGSMTGEQRSLPPTTGFLGDYSQLKPGGKDKAALVYVNPNVKWAAYESIIVEPVEFWDSMHSEVPVADQKILASFMYNTLRENLEQNFRLVDRPGPGVMVLRVAITNATAATPVLRSVSIVVPQARVLNAAQSLATGSYAFAGSARVEAEIRDSLTGERLAAAVDERQGGMSLQSAAQWKWGDAENVFEFWVKRTAQRLTELRAGGKLAE